MPDDFWGNAIFSLVPTLLFGLLFWFVVRAIIRSDGKEREVSAKVEAEERAKRAAAKEAAGS
jgi:peptidoglycan/LPS O-acetylase OafA/YrhL